MTLSADDIPPAVLRFVRVDDRVFVLPARSGPRWSSAALRRPTVTVRWSDGGEESRTCRLVIDPTLAASVRERFRETLGADSFERYFGSNPKVLVLERGESAATPNRAELIQEEFDAVSSGYSEAIEGSPVNAYLRERSRAILSRLFDGRASLLELGCGTGLETIPMLRLGHTVTAVDISPRMLEETRRRADAAGVGGRLRTVEGNLEDLEHLLGAEPPGSFDGAFSTYGAWNLVSERRPIARALARSMRRSAPLLLGVLNGRAPLPVLFAILTGRPAEVKARLSRPIPAEGSRFPVDVFPSSVAGTRSELAPYFEPTGAWAASLLAPPSDAPGLRAWLGMGGRRAIRSTDALLVRAPPLVHLAEWQFLTYRRTSSALSGLDQ